MFTILHGENHVKSRAAFVAELDRTRQKGYEIARLNGKNLTVEILTHALQSQMLFGAPKIVFIEELHSQPKSKKRDELIQLIKNAQNEIILWEKKMLSATDLKAFPGAVVKPFPLAKVMFTWLGALSGEKSAATKTRMLQLMRQTIAADGEFFSFAMLSRQVRQIMEAKEDPSSQPRVASQAKTFTWQQLFGLHHQLLLLDQNAKTSQKALPFQSQLELLLISL